MEYLEGIKQSTHQFLLKNKIETRSGAGTGLLLPFLLPAAFLTSYTLQAAYCSDAYVICVIFCLSLVASNILFISQSLLAPRLITFCQLLLSCTLFILIHFYMGKGIIFGAICSTVSVFGYQKLLLFIMSVNQPSMTLGEASIITQGSLLFFIASIDNLQKSILNTPTQVSLVSTVILQFGISGVLLIGFITYKAKVFRRTMPFYLLTVAIILMAVILPLQLILKRNPVLWIAQFITSDYNTVKMFIYWAICSCLAALAVSKQVEKSEKASTSVRKVFHIFAVIVFLPGLVKQCNLLYLSTGVALAVFIALEILRVLKIPPFGEALQNGFSVFSDEKDCGALALTPIYLLVGCSLPVWIHPAPCEVTDAAGFNLLPLMSGLLSVGVGDTFASWFGSRFGRHHWPGSKKTFEGTLACICSQLLMVWGLVLLGYLEVDSKEWMEVAGVIIFSSVIEAKTSQVDNLVLPLVVYSLFVAIKK